MFCFFCASPSFLSSVIRMSIFVLHTPVESDKLSPNMLAFYNFISDMKLSCLSDFFILFDLLFILIFEDVVLHIENAYQITPTDNKQHNVVNTVCSSEKSWTWCKFIPLRRSCGIVWLKISFATWGSANEWDFGPPGRKRNIYICSTFFLICMSMICCLVAAY